MPDLAPCFFRRPGLTDAFTNGDGPGGGPGGACSSSRFEQGRILLLQFLDADVADAQLVVEVLDHRLEVLDRALQERDLLLQYSDPAIAAMPANLAVAAKTRAEENQRGGKQFHRFREVLTLWKSTICTST